MNNETEKTRFEIDFVSFETEFGVKYIYIETEIESEIHLNEIHFIEIHFERNTFQ